MSGYSDGRKVEWAVIHDLTENGYETQRAASSKGVADVIAVKPGQLVFVNCKRTRMPSPAERAELLRVAGLIPGSLPLVALKPMRQALEYRLLTGHGPADWVPWTPAGGGGVSIPAYDVTFTAPDPACGHETSWRQSSWWDAQAGVYRGELVVEACTCQDTPPEPLYARLRARTRPAGVAGRPDRFQRLTEPRTEK